MSTKEFEQADAQVIAMVNNRSAEQEDTASGTAVPPTPQVNATDEGRTPQSACSADSSPRRGAKVMDWQKPLPEKDGMYFVEKENFDALEAAVKKVRKRRAVLCMVLCTVIAAVLLVTLAMPELLGWTVSLGVVSCSVVIGMALERLIFCEGW